MGSYFSLNHATNWEQTISDAPHPSIWSNVSFSPLALHQRLLLERPGRVYFSFSSGLRQGGCSIQVSDTSDASLLVAFEEEAGRLYSALLLKAPESNPHRYGRELDELILQHPSMNRSPTSQPTSPLATLSPSGTSIFSQSPTGTRRIPLTPSPPLDMEKLNKENALEETEWQYLLMYTVKDGVLLFFSNDVAECEEIVREIALSFGNEPPVPRDTNFNGSQSASAESDASDAAATMKVKLVEHRVGRAPPSSTRLLTDLVIGDLQREFAVRCDPEEQANYTNCITFCLRAMMAMSLSVRGYDIRSVCESQQNKNSLGPKAGDAACAAWEDLWRRVRP